MTQPHHEAWDDWGTVNPLYAILTDPQYRKGGDWVGFLASGEGMVGFVLAELDRLELCRHRERALDFGCGVGRLTAPLSHRFDSAVGVDVAPSMVEAARRQHADRPNLTFRVNRSGTLDWVPDQSVDLVLCLLVLQHLESTEAIEGFLGEFVRVLRPGGAVVVQLPSKVPAHRAPLPPWSTRQGLRQRTARALRRARVSPRVLYRYLDWTPEMTLLALPTERVRQVVDGAGGRIVYTTPSAVDAGGTEDRTFYITR